MNPLAPVTKIHMTNLSVETNIHQSFTKYTIPYRLLLSSRGIKCRMNRMTRRGDTLREHILWTAKEVFLEMGFERASMDVVANRAQTSKRSLYAHFQSKE